ncbi:hypothetical protein [Duganella sp. S19_KUP01_CR8]|uniref:hypothetical protein n=1 Tax=Duganella sp. S19_KUP01_CR8 TaxID=3025502 RepID=UPI002FCDA74E
MKFYFGGFMNEHRNSIYIPFTTVRTKNAIRDLVPGVLSKIDVVNTKDPEDQREVDVWAVEASDGIKIYYRDGPGSKVFLGFSDKVRVVIEEAATEGEPEVEVPVETAARTAT